MKTEKKTVVNYSDSDILTLNSEYTGNDNKTEIAAIAAKIGKSPASVRAKLSNLGLYVKADAPTPGKKGGVKKEALAAKIGQIVGLSDEEAEALEKTTMPVLNKLLARLTNGVATS